MLCWKQPNIYSTKVCIKPQQISEMTPASQLRTYAFLWNVHSFKTSHGDFLQAGTAIHPHYHDILYVARALSDGLSLNILHNK